jgi:hypothetical protein
MTKNQPSVEALQAEYDDNFAEMLLYIGNLAETFEAKGKRLREMADRLRESKATNAPLGFLDSHVTSTVFHTVNNSGWVSSAEMAVIMAGRAARSRRALADAQGGD